MSHLGPWCCLVVHFAALHTCRIVGTLDVLSKSFSVLLVQVVVSQQVAVVEPEVEDDELSNTMFTLLFE